jgi:hypothetical protein
MTTPLVIESIDHAACNLAARAAAHVGTFRCEATGDAIARCVRDACGVARAVSSSVFDVRA